MKSNHGPTVTLNPNPCPQLSPIRTGLADALHLLLGGGATLLRFILAFRRLCLRCAGR